MSGSAGANLPVAIRLTGGPEAEAAFQRVEGAAQRSMTSAAQATDRAASGTRNFGAAIGQAGFQIQDFATQVSMGQNAVTAFSTQFAQFAGIFGAGGAIAGAAVAVGAIAINLLSVGESAAEAQRRAQESFNAMQRDGEETARVIREIGDLFLTAAERSMRLAEAQRENLRLSSELQLSNAVMRQDSALQALPALDAQIARLERQAQVERQLQDRARRAGNGLVPQDNSESINAQLFTLRAQRDGLQLEIARSQDAIRRLNEQRERLPNAGRDLGLGEFGPAAPGREPAARTRVLRENNDEEERRLRLTREITAAVAAADTPFEAYQRRLEAIADLATRAEDAGQAIDPERLLRMGEAAQAALDRALNRVGDSTERANGAARDLGLTFSSAFEEAIVRGKNFSQVLQGIGQDLVRITTRRFITEPLGNAVSGLANAAGGFLGNLFGGAPAVAGARAGGGPVMAGLPYLVGERGPEIVVPNASGTVVPNHALGGLTFAPTYNIDARGADMGVLPRLRAEMAAIAQASIAQLKEEVSRGGSAARTFGRR